MFYLCEIECFSGSQWSALKLSNERLKLKKINSHCTAENVTEMNSSRIETLKTDKFFKTGSKLFISGSRVSAELLDWLHLVRYWYFYFLFTMCYLIEFKYYNLVALQNYNQDFCMTPNNQDFCIHDTF